MKGKSKRKPQAKPRVEDMVARDQAMLRLKEVGYLCEIRKDGAERVFLHYSRLSSKGKMRMYGGKVFERDLTAAISPGGK